VFQFYFRTIDSIAQCQWVERRSRYPKMQDTRFKKNENNDKLSEIIKQQQTTICDQDASITIIYVELNVLGNRFFLKLFPKKTVIN
jgi:hypothetical protein